MPRTDHDCPAYDRVSDHGQTTLTVPNSTLTTLRGGFASHIGEQLGRYALRTGIASVAAVAALALGASTAFAAETITEEFPPKPPGVRGVVSGAVGPGPYNLVIAYGTPEGTDYITTIEGNCQEETCPVQTTPTPEANETLVSAILTGTSPVFFEVS
ncbi:hypothetical protein [Pseudonocardia kunmingensis]|uniref:Uncharacterized protein n=1 Tax=Pseudonocardia kunmingensis TaxID=630975 RepID=A0A543CX66_9PSEU|nr:hypothetical protein [Pseudonocardia kunmingensis]TQM01706.1 hypothetical protein FB558_8608 [Pseudonocardia kunmingensis]